jgi:hypothetical protein
MAGRRNWGWPICAAHARSTGLPCLMKVAADDGKSLTGAASSRAHVYGSSLLGISQMVGHQWTRPKCRAWAKSRGRPCRRPVGLRRDGTFHVVCWSHGSNTPPYSERPISQTGKQRISAAAKLMWQTYRERKATGLPVWQVGRKRKPVATPPPPRPKPKPTVLSAEDIEFARRIGMRLPKSD